MTLPADPDDPALLTFFGAFDDIDPALLVPPDFDALLDLEVPPCTPTLLNNDDALIFTDGFESGDVSSWSTTLP